MGNSICLKRINRQDFTFVLDSQNLVLLSHLYGPQREKTCLRGFANNTGAD